MLNKIITPPIYKINNFKHSINFYLFKEKIHAGQTDSQKNNRLSARVQSHTKKTSSFAPVLAQAQTGIFCDIQKTGLSARRVIITAPHFYT